MKSIKLKLLVVCISLLFSYIFSSHGKLQTGEFVSDGAAEIQGPNLQAKYDALAIAKENAIIQAACTIIPPKSLADDYDFIQQTILNTPQRYITTFAVILEQQIEDILFVKILAKVNLPRLRAKLADFESNRPRISKGKIQPKIMVVIPETHIRTVRRKIPDPAAETEIIRKLLDYGFRVVDQEQIALIRDSDQVKQALRGDDKAAVAIGLEYGADVIIVGEAFSEYLQDLPGNLVSSRARVEARAVKTDTGEIIAAHGFHASGVDGTEFLSGKKALMNAANDMVKYFVKKFATLRTDFILAQIVVSGTNYTQLKTLNSVLEDSPQVAAVQASNLTQGVAKLEVRFRGTIDELGDFISNLEFEDFDLEVTGLSGSRIEVEIQE